MPNNYLRGLIGNKGMGKSYRALELTVQEPRWIGFDSLRNYGGLVESWRLPWSSQLQAVYSHVAGAKENNFGVVYFPSDDDARREAELEIILKLAAEVGDVTVLIDEIDLYCNAATMSPMVKKIVNYGRHSETSLNWTARRFADVNRTLTSQSDELVFFGIGNEPADLEAIGKRIGAEHALRLRSLPPRHALIWKQDGDSLTEYPREKVTESRAEPPCIPEKSIEQCDPAADESADDQQAEPSSIEPTHRS